ncbi:MAG: hypothetical protein WB952_11675 [Terriglobales bacterium]
MQTWKRALLAGSVGTATAMFLRRKPAAGMILAGVGLATLASEYPEKFAEIRERLPGYIERGTNYVELVARMAERLAEIAEGRGAAWYEAFPRG